MKIRLLFALCILLLQPCRAGRTSDTDLLSLSSVLRSQFSVLTSPFSVLTSHFSSLTPLSLPPHSDTLTLLSPAGNNQLQFWLDEKGHPFYSLSHNATPVVKPSPMGFKLEWRKSDLASGFSVSHVQRTTFDETWHPVWGEEANIRNHYNELAVTLVQDHYLDHEGQRVDKPTVMVVRFRLYDDGLGFRYEFPQKIQHSTFSIQPSALPLKVGIFLMVAMTCSAEMRRVHSNWRSSPLWRGHQRKSKWSKSSRMSFQQEWHVW